MKKIGFFLAMVVLFSVANVNNAFGRSNQIDSENNSVIVISELFSRKELRAIRMEAEKSLPEFTNFDFYVEKNGIRIQIMFTNARSGQERHVVKISLDGYARIDSEGGFARTESKEVLVQKFVKKVQEILDKTDS